MNESNQANIFINSMLDGYIDSQVQHSVIKTHAKESIALLDHGNVNISDVNSTITQKVEFTETEISPFHQQDIDCSNVVVNVVDRERSMTRYSQKKIDFAQLEKIFVASFSPGKNGRRPYPSAGGLYPVEPLVFLFPERIDAFPSNTPGCYHYRPLSKQLQLIKSMSKKHFFDNLLHGLVKPDHEPCFAILYLAVINKATFKYRFRGYRHAVLEAGSMYQQATTVSQNAGLRTTIWSSFSEQQMNHALGLDHHAYMPLTLQFFGYGE